ncbi:hypothetical protein QJS10_CPA09g01604 [Acorus calamus]|uniref:Choline transporter-like protein n=1 Tax=Acorus calamus TaxID=4465 RepID=A0AAV9E800_ACOCL|nr:hypothetical protein QJS10_CPA09g01604 [Acorus calamus]
MGGPLGAIIGRYPTMGRPEQEGPQDGTGGGGIIHHNRKCRDLVFLFIFIAFWVAMIVNSSFAFNQGNPLRLTYGLDYKGNVCGDRHGDPDLRELEVKYWMNPNQVYQSGFKNTQSVLWSCQFIARASNASMRHWQQMGGVNIDENIIIDKTIHRAINSPSAVLKRYVADIGKTWPVLIVCGAILPLFLSVVWLLMIQHFVAGMTWITVSVFNILIIGVTMFFYTKAGWIGNDAISSIIGVGDPYYSTTGRELNHLRVATVLMTIVMVVCILSTIAIVRRILMATSVLKVAAKVIGEVQALIVYPVIPYIILVIFYMFWISAALHLFSSGQILQNDCQDCCAYDLKINRVNCDSCCGYRIHYTPHIAVAIIFHLFGCYWVTQFIVACSSTVIAGSVASYYWGRGEISIAITGKSFCKASVIATGLIMNNILRIGKVNVIGDVILFLGKLCVSLFSAVFAFLMLDTHKYSSAHNKISSPLFPVLVCWGLGYVVSTLFFAVVEMAIDTIILSFCQDAEEHQGTAQYAPPLLMETLDVKKRRRDSPKDHEHISTFR